MLLLHDINNNFFRCVYFRSPPTFSQFQINSSTHQQQTVTEYAKPNQGISYSHQETTIHHNDQLDSMLGLYTEAKPSQAKHASNAYFEFNFLSLFPGIFAGSLQENMNRQGVNTTQKGCCSACDKPIVGQVITALGRTWHPEHFTCSHCCQELGTRNFFERDGHPYCEPDYHNLFSPRCAYCNGAILDVRLRTQSHFGIQYSWIIYDLFWFLILFYRNVWLLWTRHGTQRFDYFLQFSPTNSLILKENQN